ncbi:MAG TPA: HDOD domain-containing protein [Candidatus Competibacteraceae bacterium]|nr:HDOD domain-containing protein [Candidatus Competibacteraceae bacterium]HRZ05857.1 HDOD domain-containing protein [Candidatus Competibacteraceae bacterium]HSA45626.1 HDOD domain-containing protein [Candidatus Competibacteraceae bacterium]
MQQTPFSRKVFDRSDLLVLPVLPAIMHALLETVDEEGADFQKQIQLFSCDPVLSARLLAVSNLSTISAMPIRQRILTALGPTALRTLVVTTAMQQSGSLLPTPALNLFWRHALRCARLARQLAEMTAYPDPEEAYLCGLLHDLGKLVISVHSATALDEIYTLGRVARTPGEVVELEQRLFGVDHCVLGAEQSETWQLPVWFADAIRFHHLNAGELRGAHPLLRLLHVANALSQDHEPAAGGLTEAGGLLELSPGVLESVRAGIADKVERLAIELGIAATEAEAEPKSIRAPLESTLGEIALIDAVRSELSSADDPLTLCEAVIRCATLLADLTQMDFFHCDSLTGTLRGSPSAQWPDGFTINPEGAANALQRALQQRRICHSLEPAIPPGVIDRQLARQWDCEGIWCLPLYAGERLLGVLVAGASRAQLPRLLNRERLWKRFATAAATALAAQEQREILQRRVQEDHELLERQRLRAAIHEISNPLTIVRNSLYLLSTRLGEPATEELRALREEMERASRILLRLTEADESVEESGFDLNRTIRDLARVLDEALCRPRGLHLHLQLAEGLAPLTRGRDALRQILLNLVRNAAEVLKEGGCITVTTQDGINLHGCRYLEIAVADNGPGLPEALLTQLFQPVATAKGEEHAGLGLSIVKNLVEALDGQVGYRPNPGGGAVFLALLPHTVSLGNAH